jgi:hypothetical protein
VATAHRFHRKLDRLIDGHGRNAADWSILAQRRDLTAANRQWPDREPTLLEAVTVIRDLSARWSGFLKGRPAIV